MKPLHLFAQTPKIDANGVGIPQVDPNTALVNILSTVYFWAGVTAVIIMILAGYFYVTSGGNPSSTKRAREAIIYSVVGLVVIILAFTITQFVLGRIV